MAESQKSLLVLLDNLVIFEAICNGILLNLFNSLELEVSYTFLLNCSMLMFQKGLMGDCFLSHFGFSCRCCKDQACSPSIMEHESASGALLIWKTVKTVKRKKQNKTYIQYCVSYREALMSSVPWRSSFQRSYSIVSSSYQCFVVPQLLGGCHFNM